MQGGRKKNGAAASSEVLPVQLFDPGQMGLERTAKPLGQERDAFAHPFGLTDRNLPISEIDVLGYNAGSNRRKLVSADAVVFDSQMPANVTEKFGPG